MKNNKILLKSIVEGPGIASGYSFRSKLKNKPNGTLKVIQLKDFVEEYTAIGDECIKIEAEGIKEKFILKEGAILFISKGQNNNAVVFKEKDAHFSYIASSALFVINIDQTKANPDYIAWYINQTPVQNYIKQNLTGTYTPTVNRKVVEYIPIQLPSLKEQIKIATLGALALKEKKIRTAILKQRENLINNQLLNYTNN
ncbi:MAG: restriction endonuclease subunit S [Flavobacteriaceae bacterium]|nr:restriction endonuclease subunit S [Flavobacteriaceae bacterium]